LLAEGTILSLFETGQAGGFMEEEPKNGPKGKLRQGGEALKNLSRRPSLCHENTNPTWKKT